MGDSGNQPRSASAAGENCGKGSCGVMGMLAALGTVAEAGTALPAVGTLPSGWAVLVGDVGVIGIDPSVLAA